MAALESAAIIPDASPVIRDKLASSSTAKSAISPAVTIPQHCPYRRTTDLLQRLAPNKMRIGFLIGAGCPLAVRRPDGRALIPEIIGLTEQIKAHVDGVAELQGAAQMAWKRVILRGIPQPTIEDILGHIRTLKSICGKNDSIDGFSEDLLNKLDQNICDKVRTLVSVNLPADDTPYHTLASWIQAVHREYPVEVFTTNYDLLLEQALESQRVPYFDGFVGSDSAFLDLESMAEDDLPARWSRLWKIHGSINWRINADGKIRRSRDEMDGEQLLIYPSHLKYDESRQMPYYAMLDRLRVFLRSEQCVLITCGYSFGDEHINSYIAQGLSGNPDSTCLGLIFSDRSGVPKAVKLAKRHANLTLLAADGGIVGTLDRSWGGEIKDAHPAYAIAVGTDLPDWRTKAPKNQCKWLLGDFSALGAFLAQQLSSRDTERGAADER